MFTDRYPLDKIGGATDIGSFLHLHRPMTLVLEESFLNLEMDTGGSLTQLR